MDFSPQQLVVSWQSSTEAVDCCPWYEWNPTSKRPVPLELITSTYGAAKAATKKAALPPSSTVMLLSADCDNHVVEMPSLEVRGSQEKSGGWNEAVTDDDDSNDLLVYGISLVQYSVRRKEEGEELGANVRGF
ncbi:hypothetical protein BIW11_03150 [Tropilaelaps mercedesae]|uniref:Uncharacterized protein n=1 Tax=Tropilaelaps mercedesae TaxID=418985 RepID=A0A1V9XRH6_9ACAR|nr:hypothetical protein BIW11_03150 [Tropilaelaps mercedesae]